MLKFILRRCLEAIPTLFILIKMCIRDRIHCVLVDESQFLTREQVHELSEVVDTLDIPVLCYGLRTDFRGELFTLQQVAAVAGETFANRVID